MQPELTPAYVCRRRRTGSQDRTDLDELLEIYFLALPAQEKLHPPCCERPPAESQRGAASSSVVFARGADDCCRLDFSYSCLVLCQGSRIPQQVACCLAPPGRRPLLRGGQRRRLARARGGACACGGPRDCSSVERRLLINCNKPGSRRRRYEFLVHVCGGGRGCALLRAAASATDKKTLCAAING